MFGGLRGGRTAVVGEPDTRVTDPQALEEIILYGEVVIAASSSEARLSERELDRVLGLDGHALDGRQIDLRLAATRVQPKAE